MAIFHIHWWRTQHVRWTKDGLVLEQECRCGETREKFEEWEPAPEYR